ncbi:class I SAM-dependent methyltransferase, partial [Sinorhizobium sojae]
MTMRFDDLAALEPAFLARLDPAEYGWDAEDLALALAAATPDLAAYILDNLAPESSGAVRSELDAQPDPDPLSALRAQQRIISALFWELIYRRHPDAYDAFAEIQAFPFPDLFPATLLSGARVLDVGCGTGALTRWVARHAKEATGVDPVAPMLAVARRRSRNGASFRLGRFSDLPFPADSFEVVVSNMAFQPFEDSGGISGLNEMRR